MADTENGKAGTDPAENTVSGEAANERMTRKSPSRPSKVVSKETKEAKSESARNSSSKQKISFGLIGRLVAFLARFIREIIAELRKVIWPTRKELVTFSTVVILFVAVMVALIGALDYGLAKAVLAIFGNSTS